MDNEFELPPITAAQNGVLPSLCEHVQGRKRARLEDDVKTSSDPAIFSSDDHAPTAEDYNSKRRKQKWSGTWWGEKSSGLAASGMSDGGKRKFTRNFDSGVWMGSEGTDASVEEELLKELQSAEKPANLLTLPPAGIEPGFNYITEDMAAFEHTGRRKAYQSQAPQMTSEVTRTASLYAAVETIIDHCLEAGDENVDLSSMSLENVPNSSLRRLKSLTKHTTIRDVPPSQDSYSPIEAALHLYLSNNILTAFPSSILNLTPLRVLSVRHNNLTHLPPALAKLPHLHHLNIAANRLKHLPYEMLRLYNRPEFEMVATPNPFDQLPLDQRIPECDPDILWTKQPRFVARSLNTYFHADAVTSIPTSGQVSPASKVPSLLELVLRKCKDLPDLVELQDWCTAGNGPATLSKPLAFAQEAASYGDLECTICGKGFIVPRVQWMEWWRLPAEKRIMQMGLRDPWMVPYLRRGCGWDCVEEGEM